ncbi:hypothetical protein NLU13_5234 [Sarocladium strictum]|uniref:FAD dependent oxidoreductase domain-containing protein n=1 Tax=Sarocladium strictum TaxID=5046 RepID=A0AA39GH37_SARSR|nr:hypothetical protein NLU13_5234 [Sarocladium strictum]
MDAQQGWTVDARLSPDQLEKLRQYESNPAIARLLKSIAEAVSQDPGLPREKPTISSWQVPEHASVASIQSEKLPELTDYAVIGSGITGCSVTKTLLEHKLAAGCHVTVFEARTLVSGATGRNGGHLVTASGHTFGPLAAEHGVEAAKQITRFSIMNIEHVMKMVREMDQDLQDYCQIRNVRKVMAVRDEETWAAAKQSVEDFQAAVPEYRNYHRIVSRSDVPGRWNVKGCAGAVEHDAGAIWPYRLLTGIFERLLRQYPDRLAIEAHTPVSQVLHSPGDNEAYPYILRTPRGDVRAKKVIHCTNAHAAHLIPQLAGRIYPFRGTMTVQEPGPELPLVGDSRSWSLAHKPKLDARTGLWDTGLYYLQQNALTGRIWIGNETALMKDILTTDDTYVPEESKQALSTMLPNYFLNGWATAKTSNIESIWSGIQGHTADGLPIVGNVPSSMIGGDNEDNGQWIAAGFNGYGMDKCWLTGEALANMVLSQDVSGWFPEAFLVTEERLKAGLSVGNTLLKFAAMAEADYEETSKL